MSWGEAHATRPLPPVTNPPAGPTLAEQLVKPLAEQLVKLGDGLAGILEVCTGHRARMAAAGWNESAVDLAVLHLHNEMITKIMRT